MKKFNVIWKETYIRNVKSGSFIAMLLMPFIMGLIIMAIGIYTSGEQVKSFSQPVSVLTDSQELSQYIQASDIQLQVSVVQNEKEAIQQLNDGKIEGYAVIKQLNQERPSIQFYTKATSQAVELGELEQVIKNYNLIQYAAKNNLPLEQVSYILTQSVEVESNTLSAEELEKGNAVVEDEGNEKMFVRQGMAYLVVIVLFIFIMNYSGMIGQEIATDKGTRMMEVILSSTTAQTHFFGKLVGIIGVLLTQIAIYVGTFFAANLATNQLSNMLPPAIKNFLDSGILSEGGEMLALTSLYAALGCLMYTVLSAFLGSIVSKVEDIQKVISPLSLVGIAGFYIGMFALTAPNNTLVQYSSLFPLFTPFVMPFRLAAGTVASVEIISSIVLMAVSALIILYVSIIFYKTNVLVYSDKGPIQVLKQSFSIFKSKGKR